MKIKETIYQTPQGKSEKGYIIDGRTYKDPTGTQRVDIGSVVPTEGGTYVYTGLGGVETPTSIAGKLNDAYKASQQNLRSAFDAEKNAINTATRNKTESINAQKRAVNERYEDANKSAYQAYLQASNPYGAAEEQRARIGLSDSGYAESSKMKLANTYQQSLAENLRNKNEYLNELENAYREARYQGDIELANAISEYEKLVYKHGIDAAEAIANQQNRAYEAGILANNEKWNREMDERAHQTSRYDELWQRAYRLAQMGFSNAEIARTLGVSEGQLARIIMEG